MYHEYIHVHVAYILYINVCTYIHVHMYDISVCMPVHVCMHACIEVHIYSTEIKIYG